MRHICKKTIAALFAVILVMLAAVLPLSATKDSATVEPPVIEGASAYYLYNFENNRVLCQAGTGEVLYPASTVKVMTGIIAIEELGSDLDRKITITSDMLATVAGNRLGLVAGEIVTVRDMLYATLEGGYNDAALVLACTVAGSVDEFVGMMNTKASLLGAFDTHYTNPTGLHDDAMITTASDTAKIAKHAAGLPLLVEITSSPKYVMEKTNLKDFRNIYNRNCLISKFYDTYAEPYRYEGATGMNAGSTGKAGSVVIATAKNDDGDLTYLAIVMGATSDDKENFAYAGAVKLLDWAFSEWGYLDVLDVDKMICEIPVSLSSAVDHVTLSPKDSLRVYLPTRTDVDREIEYSYTTLYEELAAPVKKGDVAGAVTVVYKGEVIGSSDLVANIDVERSEFLYILDQIEEFTGSRFFIGAVVSAVILSAVYIFINARVKSKPRGF